MDISPYMADLESKGYTLIRQGNDARTVAMLLEKIKHCFDTSPLPDQSHIPYLNRGHQVLYNLQNRDIYFVTAMLRHTLVTEIFKKLLNDEWYRQIPQDQPNYILRALLARSGGPEPLPLHIDSFVPSSGRYCWMAQTSFILEDQTEENGCTVVVPGSHLFNRYATQDAMKDAVPVISQAGDIMIWDSRLWHGTRGNTGDGTRWAFIGTFCRWWIKQNYKITDTFPKEFYAQISDSERAVLGFCSMPPRDEYERIDIKGGYELLPPALS